jgi:hypothetical protein
MVQRRTLLMCEANILLALRRTWIQFADLESDEFLFYLVQEKRSITRTPEIRRIYDAAEGHKRLLYNCHAPSQVECGPLESFLSEFGFASELDGVIGIFQGAPSEFIEECYARTPDLRILGPHNQLSGFERRWESNYAYVQR